MKAQTVFSPDMKHPLRSNAQHSILSSSSNPEFKYEYGAYFIPQTGSISRVKSASLLHEECSRQQNRPGHCL